MGKVSGLPFMAYIDSRALRSQPTLVILVPEAKAELFSLCPLTLTHTAHFQRN